MNDAVYIARKEDSPNEKGKWEAVGAQFQHPYVFKTLFSKEPIKFKDMCETKSVTSVMYLDFTGEDDVPMVLDRDDKLVFVGKAGQFTPIKPGRGGGALLRKKDDKFYAVTGTKDFRWLESETVSNSKKEKDIDESYFIRLVDAAKDTINKFGDFSWFVDD